MLSVAEKRLSELYELLEVSLEKPDWTRIARIDQAISSCLQQYPLAQLDEGARNQRQRLSSLHDQARRLCAEECERLRLLLLRHLEYGEARNAYGRIDLYQEGN